MTDVPRLTIGIEEEFQIVDAEGHLKSHIDTLLTAARPHLGEQVKPETMQSVVEVGTKICADLGVSRRTFYEWRAKGRAPRCIALPNGALRVRRAEYERWLSSREGAA